MIWPWKNIPDYKRGWLKGVNDFNIVFGFAWDFIFTAVFIWIFSDRFGDRTIKGVAAMIVCLLYAIIAMISIFISTNNLFYPDVVGCKPESEPPSTSFACNYEGGTCSNAPGYNDSGSPQCSDVNKEVYYNIESFKRYIVDEKADDDEPSGSKYKFSLLKAIYTEISMVAYILIISIICIFGAEFRSAVAGNKGYWQKWTTGAYVFGIIFFGVSLGLNIAFFKEKNLILHGIKNPLPPALLMIVSLFVGYYLTKPWPWPTQHYNSEIFRFMAFFPILFVQIIPGIQNYLESNDSCENKTKPLCLNETDNPCAWSGDDNKCKDYHSVYSLPPSSPPPPPPPPPPPDPLKPCSEYNDESGCNTGNNCYYVKANLDRSEFSPEGITKVDSKTGCISEDNKCDDYSCNSEFYPLNIFDVCCEKQLTTNGCDIDERKSHLQKADLDELKNDSSDIKTLYGQEAWSKKVDYDESYRYCESKNRRSEMEAGIYA
tara:strand:+ start:3600 stop:5060 length:1461 start_codon:yes stop_codon:yes gene_type:complete